MTSDQAHDQRRQAVRHTVSQAHGQAHGPSRQAVMHTGQAHGPPRQVRTPMTACTGHEIEGRRRARDRYKPCKGERHEVIIHM
eukprot:scaffold140023_cov22-Tisochrysis_lutea.AAC.1